MIKYAVVIKDTVVLCSDKTIVAKLVGVSVDTVSRRFKIDVSSVINGIFFTSKVEIIKSKRGNPDNLIKYR